MGMRFFKRVIVVLAFLSSFATLCFGANTRQLYLLTKPVDSDVALGPFARIAHPVIVAGSSMLKASILYAHTGEPLSVVSLVLWDLVKSPAALAADSSVDITIRQWWHKRKMLKEVAKIPGVARILVLTAGNMQFEGALATGKKNTGYIFVEADTPLDATASWAEKFGTPLKIENAGETRVQLTLKMAGDPHPVVWETTLKEVFDKKQMPDNVAEAWTEGLKSYAQGQSPLARYVTHSHEKTGLEVDATLLLPGGEQKELGTLIQGAAVSKLLGLSPLKRGANYIRAKFLGRPLSGTQAIPLCERILSEVQYPTDPF